ncbi:MAG: radical SAM protein, partial [Planctomycetota bacterium]|nr:radical SAM protein [Planctomycetota bacterium]
VIDLRLDKASIQSRFNEVLAFKPDVVGVTAMSIESEVMASTIEFLATNLPTRPFFVVGGSHATAFSENTATLPYVDCAVIGEGEETAVDLVRSLKENRPLEEVKGIVFSREGRLVRTPARDPIADLDDLPRAAWDLIDVEKYFVNPNFHDSRGDKKRILPIFTSRGCPFHCAYCLHMMGARFRARSAENVVEEIKFLRGRYQIEEIQIEDDIFNFDRVRAARILESLVSENLHLDICFPDGLKADLLRKEDIALYRKAGVYQICFGVESASDRVLSMIGKKQNLDRISEVIADCVREGIGTHGFFMIGFPGETEEEIRRTIEFARNSRLITANFSLVKLFPGTALYEKFGKPSAKPQNGYSFSYDLVGANLTEVNDERLMQLRALAYRRFYLKPRRIWDVWRFTPNKGRLFKKNLFSVLKLCIRGTNVQKPVAAAPQAQGNPASS